MSVFTQLSYHSERGLVEIPDERWPYSHHPDELGAYSGTLHFLPGRGHTPHYYYAKHSLSEVDLGGGGLISVDCLISACTDLFLHTSYLRCLQGA